MKKLALLALLSTQAFGNVCPDLRGEYHCLVKPTLYSRLRIVQMPTSNQVMTYIFDYLSVPGEPERIPASAFGEQGEFGWYTKCKNNRLMSIPGGYENMLSEIFLDNKGDLIRMLNGRVVAKCPNVKND